MSDASNAARNLRDRVSGTTEERLGKALSDLLENPLLTGAIGRAFDAREKAVQAQEVAMGALNIPSAADVEKLTRRLRSVSHRLEGIEDGVDRLDHALAPAGAENAQIGQRLSAIEAQLQRLTDKLDRAGELSAKPKAGDAGAKADAARPRARGAKAKAKGGAAKPRARANKARTRSAKPGKA